MRDWFRSWVSDTEIGFLLVAAYATVIFSIICTFV